MRVKKQLSLLMVFVLVLTLFPLSAVFAEETAQDVEILLTSGTSDMDVSNFEENLKTILEESYGINRNRVRVTKAGAKTVDSKDSFDWTIYDHYYHPDYEADGTEPVEWSVYHSVYQPYFYYKEDSPFDYTSYFEDVSLEDQSMAASYYRSQHIYPKDKDIYFIGYSRPAFKDFMLYPDTNTGEKTVSFSIYEEGVSTHTLEGAGFLFNAGITEEIAEDNTVINRLNGYLVFYDYYYQQIRLYRLTNVDAKLFHHQEYYNTLYGLSQNSSSGVELITSKPFNSAAEVKNIEVKVTKDSFKFTADDVVIYDTTENGADSAITLEDTGAGGFGPLVGYTSHYCYELSYFIFKNLTMETHKPVTFLNLVNQMTWQNNTRRFIVNLDDDGVPEFSNSQELNQILTQMKNNNVYYLGWGLNSLVTEGLSNQTQADQFITSNDGKGLFINQEDAVEDPYTEGLVDIARYISQNLADPTPPAPPTNDRHSGGGGGGGSSVIVVPPAPSFPDLANHWSKGNVERMALKEIVKGYPDGSFAPNRIVTRAEFTAMLARAFDFAKVKKPDSTQKRFWEVTEGDWYYDPVARLAPDDIILGYGNGTFGPNRNITREEAAVIIARALAKLGIELTEGELSFSDSDQVSFWAKGPLGQIQNLGIILGMPNGSFQPSGNTTRAEAATMIYRMLEKVNLL